MKTRHWLMIIGAVALVSVLVLGAFVVARSPENDQACVTSPASNMSVAHLWNEALLDAIRRDVPAPTVHARNLFHTSIAMWDAWAAYDSTSTGYFVTEKLRSDDISDARNEAISYAAYRVLEIRYLDSMGARDSILEFDALMNELCYDIDNRGTEGDDPAAFGNRVAATVLATTLDDGANEAEGYASPDYTAVNVALVVDESGADLADPNRWQPLQIEEMISQNGIAVQNGVQEFIDPHWGYVTSFAMPPAGENGVPVDPGDPPYLHDRETDQEYKDAAVEVIHFSSLLDPTAGVMIDVSPNTLGANPLGTQDGTGYRVNPVTGQPYEPNLVNEADFGRVAAEFWADGPASETPPGHWNTLANSVSDSLGELRIGGTGELLDRLEWDVKLYLALNGATHDAAVAAWGTKGYYDYVRPISMIRYMGGLGQSSDPSGDAFHADGLPLEEGLVEVITDVTTATGERHEALEGHEGEIAIFAYAGIPDDRDTTVSGVEWILAVDWVPYQLPTFVTPSFAAYVSGHSTFSRAAAEVLTKITGSEFFPGGLGEWVIEADSLHFESGPDADVHLQWATYQDAADQAGISRLYGGIHVRADDFSGRLMGEEIGLAAWDRALEFYGEGNGG